MLGQRLQGWTNIEKTLGEGITISRPHPHDVYNLQKTGKEQTRWKWCVDKGDVVEALIWIGN